ncbi:MAG: protein-ADP-ribose hydrolase [Candidatus Thiodiazotropha endolucinida]
MHFNDYADDIHLFKPYSRTERSIASPLEQAVAALRSDPNSEGFVEKYPLPTDTAERRRWLQVALTVRLPGNLPAELVASVNQILQSELAEKPVTEASELPRLPGSFIMAESISIWEGDITTLKIDAITNAANTRLLGCFQPFHQCIDNAINCAAGPQLREDCNRIMVLQGQDEQTGTAKITRAYNLPSRFVLHTVGPIVSQGNPTQHQARQLASCYVSCLSLAAKAGVRSVALCGISTGVFGYPVRQAAEIALNAVVNWLAANPKALDHVVFNTFGEHATAVILDAVHNRGNT